MAEFRRNRKADILTRVEVLDILNGLLQSCSELVVSPAPWQFVVPRYVGRQLVQDIGKRFHTRNSNAFVHNSRTCLHGECDGTRSACYSYSDCAAFHASFSSFSI